MTHLFEPFALRDARLRNRIVVSPMCQYSCSDGSGLANEWHLVHLGQFAAGGAGLVMTEATAVEARGRISPADLGLWEDRQIEPLARVVRFVEGQGAVPGIQLAHAGRKGSTAAPWDGGLAVLADRGGWTPVGPSAVPFGEGYPQPAELDEAGIRAVVNAFAAAAGRAREAGFRLVEIHAGHGYLLHQFLSPLANRREDRWGGSFENRTRLVREVATAIRGAWPGGLPVMIRISATDWTDGGWDVDQTVDLARQLATQGLVDLVDVTSGGVAPARIPVGPGYQAAFAERVRREARIATGAVGMLTTPEQCDHVVRTGQADVVLLARELLRDPHFPLRAGRALGHDAPWPRQYLRAKG